MDWADVCRFKGFSRSSDKNKARSLLLPRESEHLRIKYLVCGLPVCVARGKFKMGGNATDDTILMRMCDKLSIFVSVYLN